jgi:hypothetical protein
MEFLTVFGKNKVFWDVTPYILANIGGHFRKTRYLQFQGKTGSDMGKHRAL